MELLDFVQQHIGHMATIERKGSNGVTQGQLNFRPKATMILGVPVVNITAIFCCAENWKNS